MTSLIAPSRFETLSFEFIFVLTMSTLSYERKLLLWTQEMDKDGDGYVTFKEMLKLIYRNANAEDIEVMWSWVSRAS